MEMLVRRFKVLKAVAFVTYKEWAAYRSHMMVSLFVGPVFFMAQVFIWRSLYSGREALYGLSLNDMITYFGIVTLINYITMDFADWNLQMLIHTGKFVTFALRPLHHRFFALSQKIGHRVLGLVFELLPVYLIIRFVLGIRLAPVYPGWAALSAVLGFLSMFYINYSIGISGFWLTRTGALRGVYLLLRSMFSGAFVPLVFFPLFVQKLLIFLPFQYTTYIPVAVFMGKYQLGGMTLAIPAAVGIQALAVIVLFVVSEALYRLGIRRFTGVGA
jgi:ABC-2 type transport system permease protein